MPTGLDVGNDLHGRRSATDDCYTLTGEVDLVVPGSAVQHITLEGFSAFYGGPLPLAVRYALVCVKATARWKSNLLQYTAGVDEEVGLVLENMAGIITALDLDMPLLVLLVPRGADHLMAEMHILEEAVVLRHLLEVCQDLGCCGVAEARISLPRISALGRTLTRTTIPATGPKNIGTAPRGCHRHIRGTCSRTRCRRCPGSSRSRRGRCRAGSCRCRGRS